MGDGTEEPSATLAGSTCGRCDRVAYPSERYGCERCGAPPAEIVATALAPTGTVRSAAVVHRHRAPDPPTPFVVVEVELDAGPVVRSLLTGPAADATAGADGLRGRRVVGTPAGDRIAFALAAPS